MTTTNIVNTRLWDEQTGYPTPGLNPTRFTLAFAKLPNLQLFCNKIELPSIELGRATQPSPFLDMKQVGEKLVYSDFSCNFILDNQLDAYRELHKWMKKLSTQGLNTDVVSDCKLLTDAGDFTFVNVFPVALGEIRFDSTQQDIQWVSCEVTFACDYYYIND